MKIIKGGIMVKNQHYIPQFYLNRFGTNGKIDIFDIKNNKYIKNSNISNWACEKYFYDIDLTKIEDELKIFKNIPGINIDEESYKKAIENPQFIETTVSKLESKMSDYLKYLCSSLRFFFKFILSLNTFYILEY